jgi:hypothetical protein
MIAASKPLTDMASLCEAYANLACPNAAEILRELANDYRRMAEIERETRIHGERALPVPAGCCHDLVFH